MIRDLAIESTKFVEDNDSAVTIPPLAKAVLADGNDESLSGSL